MKKPEQISNKELDELINRSFLEMDTKSALNTQMLDTVAESAIPTQTFFSSLAGSALFKFGLVAAVSCVSVFVVLESDDGKIDTQTKAVEIQSDHNQPSFSSENPTEATQIQVPIPKLSSKNTSSKQVPENKSEPGLMIEPVNNEPTEQEVNYVYVASNNPENTNDAYVFPVLTEKEKKANEKDKRYMVKTAAKLLKDYYAPINKGKNLGDYYMRRTEISNLEYRVFLFDLLIQGKKDDFMKAKPQQDLWLNAAGRKSFAHLANVYFSEKKYDDYPMVNISVQAAEMYCQWLTEQVRNYDGKDARNIEFRLPSESHWLNAANVGVEKAVYPWFTDSIQNKHNLFLANFCVQKLQDQFKRPIIYPKKYTLNMNAYTSVGAVLNDTTMATVLVYAYNPNDHLLFCVCGNVSEMVYVDGSGDIRTKGGNWASDFEHLKFNSPDEFPVNPAASPMIGFRVAAYVK